MFRQNKKFYPSRKFLIWLGGVFILLIATIWLLYANGYIHADLLISESDSAKIQAQKNSPHFSFILFKPGIVSFKNGDKVKVTALLYDSNGNQITKKLNDFDFKWEENLTSKYSKKRFPPFSSETGYPNEQEIKQPFLKIAQDEKLPNVVYISANDSIDKDLAAVIYTAVAVRVVNKQTQTGFAKVVPVSMRPRQPILAWVGIDAKNKHFLFNDFYDSEGNNITNQCSASVISMGEQKMWKTGSISFSYGLKVSCSNGYTRSDLFQKSLGIFSVDWAQMASFTPSFHMVVCTGINDLYDRLLVPIGGSSFRQFRKRTCDQNELNLSNLEIAPTASIGRREMALAKLDDPLPHLFNDWSNPVDIPPNTSFSWKIDNPSLVDVIQNHSLDVLMIGRKKGTTYATLTIHSNGLTIRKKYKLIIKATLARNQSYDNNALPKLTSYQVPHLAGNSLEAWINNFKPATGGQMDILGLPGEKITLSVSATTFANDYFKTKEKKLPAHLLTYNWQIGNNFRYLEGNQHTPKIVITPKKILPARLQSDISVFVKGKFLTNEKDLYKSNFSPNFKDLTDTARVSLRVNEKYLKDRDKLILTSLLKDGLENYRQETGIYPATVTVSDNSYVWGTVYSRRPNYYQFNPQHPNKNSGPIKSWNQLVTTLKAYMPAANRKQFTNLISQANRDHYDIRYAATQYDYKIWVKLSSQNKTLMESDGGDSPSRRTGKNSSCYKMPESRWRYEVYTNNHPAWGWGCHYHMGVGLAKKVSSTPEQRDSQRRKDLKIIKTAIDKYYQKFHRLPGTDGWISPYDLNKGVKDLVDYKKLHLSYSQCAKKYGYQRCPSNESLAETLLPTGMIQSIPRDPGGNGAPTYYMHELSADGQSYSIYAKLEKPTKDDLATMKNFSPHYSWVKKYGMNYRLSGPPHPQATQQQNTNSNNQANPVSNQSAQSTNNKTSAQTAGKLTSLDGKKAYSYQISDLPTQYRKSLSFHLVKGWNSISLPYMITAKNPKESIFKGLPAYLTHSFFSRTKNKIWVYYWSGYWKSIYSDKRDKNSLGRGYYVYSSKNQTVSLTNIKAITLLAPDVPYEVTLRKYKRGPKIWNLVGNPHPRTSNVLNWRVEYQGKIKSFKDAGDWIYNRPGGKLGIQVRRGGQKGGNGIYTTTSLAPNQAGWIDTKYDGVKIIIP